MGDRLVHQGGAAKKAARPKLGVFKFASCDGCQLSILNLEDDLLALGQALASPTFLKPPAT